MADNIVERLKEKSYNGCKCIQCEAAAEIERLRAAIKEAKEIIIGCAWQGTGTDPLDPADWCDYAISAWEAVPDAIAAIDVALGEARRG